MEGAEFLLMAEVGCDEYLLLLELGGSSAFRSVLLVASYLLLEPCDVVSELVDNALLVRPLERPTATLDSSVPSNSIILPASSCFTLLSSTVNEGVDINFM